MKREKLNILILYNNWEAKVRNTILEHLKSFENYSDHHIYYLNVAYGVPFWVKYISSDLVIFHYTIMSLKWSVPEKSLFSPSITRLQKIIGYKVCLPQDEYVYNDLVCKFIHEQGIKSIFTCFDPEDYSKAYPENLTGVRHIETVFPGYLDEESLNKWSKGLKKHENREFDLGYRARRNPFWLGFAGVLKWKITDVFKKKAEGLNTNLSNDDKDVLYGENWYKFLGNCRCVLGVESGSSLLDFDGSIRKKVELFQKNFPESDFESCEQACFEGKDGNIELATISPRHFESIITKTCQVLIEGKYSGYWLLTYTIYLSKEILAM
ncbi:MAG: hypothetical protein IPO98_07080 [Saprospiraceae bacterium]|nr:hypothetical protein [Saprospiraceae bacterium]